MKNDPTAHVPPQAILQEGEDVTRELLMADGGNHAQMAMTVDIAGVTAKLGMALSIAELDIVLDKLHAVRDALAAREDAKPILAASYPTEAEQKAYGVAADQLLVTDIDAKIHARTEPVYRRQFSSARAALAAVGYEIVKGFPGPDGVFEYSVRTI